MAQSFSISNACLHFAKTEGPGGFIWKYLVSYILAAICLVALGYVIFQPLFGIWWDVVVDAMGGASEAEVEAIFVRRITEIIGWAVFGYGVMMLSGLLFWAMFEAAAQRRYVRDEGFKLRIGGDELRLIVVALIWIVLAFAYNILSLAVMGTSMSAIIVVLDNEALGGAAFMLAFLVMWFVWLWLAVRLAPAGAMTVRDRQVSFFNAWGATRRRFWPLLGAYIVLMIVIWVIGVVVWTGIGAGVGAAIWSDLARFEQAADDPAALMSAIFQFNIVGPVLTGWLLMILMQGLFAFIWAGPAALAARTDPRGGGVAQAPDVFA